jgi:hypothetical protein
LLTAENKVTFRITSKQLFNNRFINFSLVLRNNIKLVASKKSMG